MISQLVGAACVLIATLAVIGSFSYVASLNSASHRQVDVADYLRQRLQSMKSTIDLSGGLIGFVRQVETAQNKFNPTLIVDLNTPAVFSGLFGFPISTSVTIRSVPYTLTFAMAPMKFSGAALAAIPVVLGADTLVDLNFLQISASLAFAGAVPAGLDNPASRQGVVYIAK
jgi:hypothetical protein